MSNRVLITGGAGFIGSHLADELLKRGYGVRLVDCLSPQVHGPGRQRPGYLNAEAELVIGDIRNETVLRRALKAVDAVVHLAARVGVGQSMYDVVPYCTTNTQGTALLLQALIERPVQKLLIASSMSIYGEGLYRSASGALVAGPERSLEQLKRHDWELRSQDGEPLSPIPTPENKTPALASVYALSKFDQERLCLIVGRAYQIPTVALRLFNVYGPRQALSNPYTGVLAIFASRLLNGHPPRLFEDGLQRRDLVSVHDVVGACCLALESGSATGLALNIGSGQSTTILDLAGRLSQVLGRGEVKPEVTSQYRAGDVRHCFADISEARRVLGYQPQVSLEEGLRELVAWQQKQQATDSVERACSELAARGLTL